MKVQLVAAALAVVAGLIAGSVAFADDSMSSSSQQMGRYGGPVYDGAPALAVTASLVAAGGGPAKYSTATALTSMLGADTVKAEVGKLTGQYGADAVNQWLATFDFAVKDALKIATAAGVKLCRAPAAARSTSAAARCRRLRTLLAENDRAHQQRDGACRGDCECACIQLHENLPN